VDGKKTHTNADLSDHDTNDFEVGHTGDPILAADIVVLPALRPDLGEERLKVSNGEKNVALKTETGTRNDCVAEVPGDGRKRILLHHAADSLQFLGGSLAINLGDELRTLKPGKVGPVYTFGGIAVIRASDMAENAALMCCGGVVDGVVIFGLGLGVRTMRNWDYAGN
jgi:hypothetical protein